MRIYYCHNWYELKMILYSFINITINLIRQGVLHSAHKQTVHWIKRHLQSLIRPKKIRVFDLARSKLNNWFLEEKKDCQTEKRIILQNKYDVVPKLSSESTDIKMDNNYTFTLYLALYFLRVWNLQIFQMPCYALL